MYLYKLVSASKKARVVHVCDSFDPLAPMSKTTTRFYMSRQSSTNGPNRSMSHYESYDKLSDGNIFLEMFYYSCYDLCDVTLPKNVMIR